MEAEKPIIIIGMHRSGTSMITQMLESLGLFVGNKKEKNYESTFFLGVNNWLLQRSGGAWDHPGPVRYILNNPRARSLVVEHLQYWLQSPKVISYLGWKKYLQYRTPAALNCIWGWKDPRNTFTLPFWLELFPYARVIHIFRNGVDVAASLKARQERKLNHATTLWQEQRLRYRFVLTWDWTSLRCASLDEGFSLWEEYVCEARSHVNNLKNRAIEVRYEDFLTDPFELLKRLVRFCGLLVNNDTIAQVCAQGKIDRAYAFRNKPELMEFAEGVAARLSAVGYCV
jgi:hypothetical protein